MYMFALRIGSTLGRPITHRPIINKCWEQTLVTVVNIADSSKRLCDEDANARSPSGAVRTNSYDASTRR